MTKDEKLKLAREILSKFIEFKSNDDFSGFNSYFDSLNDEQLKILSQYLRNLADSVDAFIRVHNM